MQEPRKPTLLLLVYTCLALVLAVSLRHTGDWHPAIPALLFVATLVPVVLLYRVPKVAPPTTYSCPWVPAVPLFGIFCNLYLICSLTVMSYYRILVTTVVSCGW